MRPLLFTILSLSALACAPVAAAAPPPQPPQTPQQPHRHHADSDDDDECDGPGAPPGTGTGSIDVSVQVKPNGFVDVHEFAGSVHVTAWAQSTLHVQGHFSSDCHVDVSPSGDRQEVHLSCSHGPGSGELEIQVPQTSGLEVRTMSAGISVQGVNGGLRLHTVVGDISVKGGTSNEIEARSTSGDVKIEAASPSVHAETVSGTVQILGARGHARVRTVSGDCTLSGGEFNEISIESVSGEVAFTGAIVGQGPVELTSHSGDIALHLPATTNADVEMRTFSGDLVLDMGSGRKEAERELDAKIGGGGTKLRLRSFSGDVKVTR